MKKIVVSVHCRVSQTFSLNVKYVMSVSLILQCGMELSYITPWETFLFRVYGVPRDTISDCNAEIIIF